MTDGFDRFCYFTKDAKTGLPVLTRLIYDICNEDHEKFKEAVEMLRMAYEAGCKDGEKQ